MKTTLLTLVFGFVLSVSALAQSPTQIATATDHLTAVNPLWSNHTADHNEPMAFENEDERIAYHLTTVIAMLKEKTSLASPVAMKRLSLLNALDTYSLEKRFPINTRHDQRTSYFIDDYGTACAVGHLMRVSGHSDLALRISSEYNYSKLADIRTEGVNVWAAEHGFEMDELALIQPAYPPANAMNGIGQGVNGAVYQMYSHPTWDRLYISGEFAQMDGSVDCPSGFGYIENSEYHCVANVPFGVIQDMTHTSDGNQLLVAGQFIVEGAVQQLGVYDGENWSYMNIPNRPAADIRAVKTTEDDFASVLVALSPNDAPNSDELWRLDVTAGTEEWVEVLSTNGEIWSIDPGANTYCGGNFTEVIDHGQGDLVLESTGLVGITSTALDGDVLSPFVSELMPSMVTSIRSDGETVYAAGTSSGGLTPSFLIKIENGVYTSLIQEGESEDGTTSVIGSGIWDMELLPTGEIVIGGEFFMSTFTIFGNNLGLYHPDTGLLNPLGYFTFVDAVVTSLSPFNGEMAFGGLFIETAPPGLNSIGTISIVTDINEIEQTTVTTFPNPVTETLFIDIDTQGLETIVVVDMQGKETAIDIRREGGRLQADVRTLSPGAYVISLVTTKGRYSAQFVKQ